MNCKKCNKILPRKNTSGYCRHCYLYTKNKERVKRLKKENRCYCCGKKVKKIIIYPTRCKKCSERKKPYFKEYYQKSLKTKKEIN